MLKFLRKYNKWILAVGGTLLMITFLIPEAIQRLSQAGAVRSANWATYNAADEKTVTLSLADLNRLQREMKLLDDLNPGALESLGVKTPQHWFLMVHEAEQAGLIGGRADGMRYLPEPQDETLAMLRTRSGEDPHFILETLAKVRGVGRLQSQWLNAPQFSDRRLKNAGRRLYHNVIGNMVVIDAQSPEQPIEPTDEQVLATFEKHKDVAPGEGEKGFGYKLPDRVKLEWIEIPADSVRAMIEQSDAMSGVALRKHWAKNGGRLGVGPPSGGGAVPEAVRDDLLQELLTAKLDEIAKFGADELDAAQRGLARDAGYFVLPEDWPQRKPGFEHLAQRIQEKFSIALPAYHAIGDRWLTLEDVAELEGIGEATTLQFGEFPIALPELVALERSFIDEASASSISIQRGIAGPPLSTEDGSLYFFRMIDADAARAPTSVDEVRDKVIDDLEREAHFAELLSRQEELRSAALDMGLLRFAMAHNTVVHPSGSISERGQPQLPEIGYVESVVKAIIDKAMQLPPGVAPADMTPDMKTFVIAVEEKLALVVFEVTTSSPLTEETYRAIASPMQNPSMPGLTTPAQLQMQLRAKELQGEQTIAAFEFDSMAGRYDFKVLSAEAESEGAEAEADGAAPAQPAKTASK